MYNSETRNRTKSAPLKWRHKCWFLIISTGVACWDDESRGAEYAGNWDVEWVEEGLGLGKCFPQQPTRSLDKLSQQDPGRIPGRKAFWRIFSYEDASASNNLHYFCAGTKKIGVVARAKCGANWYFCRGCAAGTGAFSQSAPEKVGAYGWKNAYTCTRHTICLLIKFILVANKVHNHYERYVVYPI